MPCLVNQVGRVVAVDNIEQYNDWLKMPGFRKATAEEEQKFVASRYEQLAKQRAGEETPENGLYISTVSEGGTDGYSNAAGCIIKQLKAMDVDVKTYYDGQKIAILFHNPYSIMQIESQYRVIYTMFESDKIPDNWKDYLESADEVWVPSKWCADVFAKSGIKASVVPLGYDDTIYKYCEREPVRERRRDFTFLHYNAFNIRKGFPEVFKAFTQEFGKDEPVKLLLKTTLDRAPLPITQAEYPNIEIIYGKVPPKQLLNIMQNSDCFVFPSRGEGFGITPLECMATGMPAIVPNAHGISEYFNPEYMYEVKVADTCPGLYSRYKGMDVGKMVVCDIDDLRRQMRWVYEHETQAMAMGKSASEYVKKWTFEKTAKNIQERFVAQLARPITPKPMGNILNLETV